MLAKVGDDGFGTELIAGLRGAGVNAEAVERVAGEATGVALIMVGADGENAISVASGANATADAAWIDRHESLIAAAKVCLFQLEIPQETVAHGIEVCRRHGVLTVLDTAPVPAEPLAGLFAADVVSPNAGEAELLTGVRPTGSDAASIQKVIDGLRERGAKRVVLKLGGQGAVAFENGRVEHVVAHHVEAIDTTAAGDAFTAALGVALMRGHSLFEATRYANGAGGAACTVMGAQPSMPSAATVQSLLDT
jgi:ribokinase